MEKEIAAGDHDIVLFHLHRAAFSDDVMPLVFHSSNFHSLTPLAQVLPASSLPAKM